MLCDKCRRWFSNRPRKGPHKCLNYFQYGSCITRCDCDCNAISPDFIPPTMALDNLPTEP